MSDLGLLFRRKYNSYFIHKPETLKNLLTISAKKR